MIRITEIAPESIAARLGLQAGDRLLTIDNHEIYDVLGLIFWSSESDITVTIQRNGKPVTLTCRKDPDQDLGIVLSDLQTRRCTNNCVFCYVDQLPQNLRASLYVKDEDYRLSFLHGNYVTLTNLSNNDLQRIIEERLSPLYVSVHATDPRIRQRLLGLQKPDNILNTMRLLTDSGIRLHAQIVICPGWNDGDVLRNTVQDLTRFVPGVQSISLVPVGLTKHRNGLTPIRSMTIEEARAVMRAVRRWQKQYLQRYGTRLVYPSDELLLMTNSRIPGTSYYEDFPQIENGVGLIRMLINDLQSQRKQLPNQLNNIHLSIVTGVLAAPILRERLMPLFLFVNGLNINIIEVKNQLLGESVTVSGLLFGRDILNELKQHELGDAVVLPPNLLNGNGMFLDDLTLSEFCKSLKIPVFVYGEKVKFPLILRKISEKK